MCTSVCSGEYVHVTMLICTNPLCSCAYFFALFPLLIRYTEQLGQKYATGQRENVDELSRLFFSSMPIKKWKVTVPEMLALKRS